MRPVVAFTANDRPQYLRQVLESWREARGISGARLIFRCEPGCPEVAELCRGADFGASLHVIVNRERHGPLGNPWHAMETGFATDAPFVICAEDDTIVSGDVLEYFAWCAERYAGDAAVITACAFAHHQRPGGPGGVVTGPDFKSWIWGTWADRWNLLRDDWDFDYSHKGWDWRIRDYWMTVRGHVSAFPCESRSQHIGAQGAHMTPDLLAAYSSDCFTRDRPPATFAEVPA